MEERCLVTAATGALGPALQKLSALVGDENRVDLDLEGGRSDIEVIKGNLEPLQSLLERIWGREDVDAASKNWMFEVRELSYDIEEAIDSGGDDDSFMFKKLKAKVVQVSSRCPCRGVFKTLEAMNAATGTLDRVLAELNTSLVDGERIREGM
ncbi:unnamed protein product [Urochloa humidicola]